MPDPVISLDVRQVSRNIRRLGDREVGRAMARALSRTALDIREAEVAHIQGRFPDATSRGVKFLSGFRSFGAKPDDLVAYVTPRGATPTSDPSKSERILLQQRSGGVVTLSGPVKRLGARGRLAIPVYVARGPSGRVRKRDKPSTLLGPGGRGFISPNERALLVRTSRKRTPVRLAYALAREGELDPVVEFYRVARDTAQANFIPKARREFDKIRFPGLR